MLNAFPIVGWIASFVIAASVSVPVWYCWTVCGLGRLYGSGLPEVWQSVPYWHCVGLFIVVSTVRSAVLPTNLRAVADAAAKARD